MPYHRHSTVFEEYWLTLANLRKAPVGDVNYIKSVGQPTSYEGPISLQGGKMDLVRNKYKFFSDIDKCPKEAKVKFAKKVLVWCTIYEAV